MNEFTWYCLCLLDDADYVKYNSEETYIAMVSTKDKSSDDTSELVAVVASYEEENRESLIVEV